MAIRKENHRVRFGEFGIAWHFEEDPSRPDRLVFAVEVPDMPGWVSFLDHELRSGVITLVGARTELASEQAEPLPLYRKLGGSELERIIKSELQQDFLRDYLPPAWQAAALATRRSGRRPASNLELAQLCRAYLDAWEENSRAPMPLLAEREHRSINTLQGLIRLAVDRELFVRAGQGRPGGQLTEKALGLLKNRRR